MSLAESEIIARSERLRAGMREEGLDALIVYSDEYRSGHGTYLTNYKPINVVEESPQLVILVGDDAPAVLLGRLNLYAAKDVIWMDRVAPIHRAAEVLPEVFAGIASRSARVGLVGDNLLPVSLYQTIREALPKAEFVSVTPLMIALRQIKSPAEVALMERAAEINDQVLREVLPRCHVGMTEMQVAGEAEYVARRLGADIGSATVVMAGPNTNYPAWRPSERVIEPGDFVLVDFNPAVEHYCNDGGITLLMPGADPAKAEALATGHRVLKEVIPLIRPQTKGSSIHDLMLERLEPLGYRDNFVPYARGMRGVGHGVGLDVVEPPDLSADSNFVLQPGMTLAVKLDLHGLPGGGFRIEVVVVVTETGVRPLNKLVLAEPDDFAILS
jgi:Xaa-Pro aminopeptidase